MSLRDRLLSLRGPLAAAGFAFFFALVLFARGHPYDLDQYGLALPYARIFRDAARAHRMPLWSSLIWCGYPVHAEGQGGFLAFPFRLAATLAPGDEVIGIEVEIGLALVLAAFAGALAARLRGRSHEASFVAGIVWALGGSLLSYQENPAVLEACWAIPLLVAMPSMPLVGGALLGLQLLAGWPYAFLLTVPLLLFTWRWRPLAAAIGIGLLIGAAQWVPTAELFLHSDRAGGLAPTAVLGEGAFALHDLARFVSPLIGAERLGQDSVVFVYLGLPAVALVAIGAYKRIGERAVFMPLALGFAVFFALLPSVAPRIGAFVASLPPFVFVRGPAKLLVIASVAASLLAADGLDAVPAKARGLALLVALDLFQFGQRRELPVERALLRVTPEIARAIPPGARTAVFEPRSVTWRHDLDAKSFAQQASLEPNANVLWGIPTVSGYGPLADERSKALAALPLPNRLARAGAEYFAIDRSFRDLEPAGTFGPTHLYRLPGAVPLARLASDAVVASSTGMAFELAAKLPPTVAVLEEPPPVAKIETGSARIIHQDDDALTVAVDAPGAALLVVALSHAPGWEAVLDGTKDAPVLRADFAFMAVPLPAGTRTVELRYRPTSFRFGLALSALGLVALFGARLRRRV